MKSFVPIYYKKKKKKEIFKNLNLEILVEHYLSVLSLAVNNSNKK